MVAESPDRMITEIKKLKMPAHHDVRAENVDMKRLGAILWLAQENKITDFEELLLLEGISTLQNAIQRSKLGNSDKSQAIQSLSKIAAKVEQDFIPNGNFDELIEKERAESWKYGGRTVFGKAKPPIVKQLTLF